MAGVLIAREAGPTVVDKDGSCHDMHSTATIAAALVDQLLPLIRVADEDYRPMKRGLPHAALDAILARTRHLIVDFDGPVCDLFAGIAPAVVPGKFAPLLAPSPRPGGRR